MVVYCWEENGSYDVFFSGFYIVVIRFFGEVFFVFIFSVCLLFYFEDFQVLCILWKFLLSFSVIYYYWDFFLVNFFYIGELVFKFNVVSLMI